MLGAVKRAATEQNDLFTARARLPELDAHVAKWRARMAPFFTLDPPARVLDVGAAQGVTMLAFQRAGFNVYGVEPWAPAIEVGEALAREVGEALDNQRGVAESLPFEDGFFRFIHAYSVLEHLDDPLAAFREAYRVLEPGGAFFFSTTSKISPRQNEISWFLGFPWYPAPLQRAVMDWVVERRPALVGHTTRPAIHWFRHRDVCVALRAIGFNRLVDFWNLRRPEEHTGAMRLLVEAARRYPPAKVAGGLVNRGGDMEYLAIK